MRQCACPFPFPLLHVDTGHKFPEVIAFRDRRSAEFGEHVRVFPISSWTELDVGQYIARERLAAPSIHLARMRPVVRRGSALVPVTPLTPPRDGERVEHVSVRFRTVGDITCTAPFASEAATFDRC
jgi:sulfate adenylyltransferase subunit 2